MDKPPAYRHAVARLMEAYVIFLLIALAIAAAVATYSTALFPFAVVAAVAAVWGNGVMANFRDDPQGAPNYAAALSMGAAIASVLLLISGLIVRSL